MKKDSPLSIGLDLGSHSAKAVLVDLAGSEPLLKGYKKFLVSQEGHFLPRSSLVSLLQEQLSGWLAEAGKFTVAVSGKDVIVRYLEMPKMSLQELKASLRFEAERYLPFRLTDAIFDAQILLETTAALNKMWVVFVAAKKGVVEDRLMILKEVGAIPTSLDATAIGLVNAFHSLSDAEVQKKSAFLMDIGAYTSSTNIVMGGVPYLSREVDFGGEHLTQFMMKEMKINYAQAEASKLQGNVAWQGPTLGLLRPLLKEIKSSFDYFEGVSEKAVEQVMLCGGSATLKGLKDYLSSHLGKPVEIFSPAKRLKKALTTGNAEEWDATSHIYAVALGLAIRGKLT